MYALQPVILALRTLSIGSLWVLAAKDIVD